tara:strand:- start:702 stop:914 length:213 start_codon:yes stop_codon:yes gene_type:complete
MQNLEHFRDYPQKQIQAKLKQVEEFEAKYGENTTTRSWKKWCNDYEYRRREWKFRQGIAEYAKHNAHKTL